MHWLKIGFPEARPDHETRLARIPSATRVICVVMITEVQARSGKRQALDLDGINEDTGTEEDSASGEKEIGRTGLQNLQGRYLANVQAVTAARSWDRVLLLAEPDDRKQGQRNVTRVSQPEFHIGDPERGKRVVDRLRL